MKFKYSKFPCNPTELFPHQRSVLRPIINIVIKYKDQRLPLLALLDTGADLCIFPASVGEYLHIPLDQGKRMEIKGISALAIAYFHEVTLGIGGWEHNCLVGFSPDFDKMNVSAILGHHGFFDHYEVLFNYKKEIIEIKKLD
jgi:hypothetical protein